MTIEQLKAITVAYVTAINGGELALADEILTETFDHDQLTDELLTFVALVAEMTLTVIDGFAEGLGHPPELVRSQLLAAFGQDALGKSTFDVTTD